MAPTSAPAQSSSTVLPGRHWLWVPEPSSPPAPASPQLSTPEPSSPASRPCGRGERPNGLKGATGQARTVRLARPDSAGSTRVSGGTPSDGTSSSARHPAPPRLRGRSPPRLGEPRHDGTTGRREVRPESPASLGRPGGGRRLLGALHRASPKGPSGPPVDRVRT